MQAAESQRLNSGGLPAAAPPAIFHITHWKAGSTWIRRVLRRSARERFVRPAQGWEPFLKPPEPGLVYSAFATRTQFEQAAPPGSRRFVVVRNLRDTLVSAYFSFRDTHPANPAIDPLREKLRAVGKEDGLLYLLDEFLPRCAAIQDSWADEALRYEVLVRNPAMLATFLRAVDLRVPDIAARPSETRWEQHFTDRVAAEFEARFWAYGSRAPHAGARS